ncbi:MAG: glycoside hydrolase family 140 protein [Anaerolineae bacterium]
MAGSDLRVSTDGRHLETLSGAPFFYLADTAWELVHVASLEQMRMYLLDRAAKRFTVIHTVILGEMNGLDTPNAYGHLPLINHNPEQPNEAYFSLVDALVSAASDLGLHIGLLPTWGAYTVQEQHPLFASHCIFNAANAYVYGRILGERYRNCPNVIWILGGDRKPDGVSDVWRAMARGIAEGTNAGKEDYTNTLMSYHPWGGTSSSQWWHAEPWLSFNMLQSGHDRDSTPDAMVAADYAREPHKPVINGEPGYEGIVNQLKTGQPKLSAWDVRKFAYSSVFAGACGHTYGANEVWQMWRPERLLVKPLPWYEPLLQAENPWYDALDYQGAGQMRHLRTLIESRSMHTLIADQNLIATPHGRGDQHIQACRRTDGTCALIYLSSGHPIAVNLCILEQTQLRAWWFDPRQGTCIPIDDIAGDLTVEFTPPSLGAENDWVLVLDDPRCNYREPGGD